MTIETFQSAELITITELCADKTIQLSRSHVRLLCREGKFPAVKVGKDWKTTRALARNYIWQGANDAFRFHSLND